MIAVVLAAILISAGVYLGIGFSLGKKTQSLADLFPIVFGKTAKVETADEFSSSTVATTVSLATIILTYFELAGYFGPYLLWTAVTTAIGMWLLSRMAKKIWDKLSVYDHRPSLHEFLGTEFNSPTLALVASICTSLGFLLIFATELIVGSRFLAQFVPQIPEWVSVIFLSSVGFIYTLVGGFRAVIKTDQIQMKLIWALIGVLIIYYLYSFLSSDFSLSWNQVPKGVLDFSPRAGLVSFLIGIALMNIPTHLSNMSIWQRIGGAQDPEVVIRGFKKSIWSLTFSWALLATLAFLAYLIIIPESNTSLFSELLILMSNSTIGKLGLFIVMIGLYGAMLSTASTNLIVVTHTVSEDILAKFKSSSLDQRIASKREFYNSRLILVLATILAVFLVEGLKYFGFSIADLVFAIYGGSLALFPPILIALYGDRKQLQKMSAFASVAVILGFSAGWGAAIYGKFIGDSNLIFLAPTVGIGVSFGAMVLGLTLRKKEEAIID